MPGNIEAEGNLLIAAFYNEDFLTMNNMSLELKGKNIEDDVLYHKMDNAVTAVDGYFPDDSLNALIQKHDSNYANIPDAELKKFIEKNPEDLYAMAGLAARMINKEQLADADSLLVKALTINADYMPALGMMCSLKREEKRFDESIVYCDRALYINKESVYVISSKSRTLLRQKKDDEALRLALAATKLDETDVYAQGTLLLAYHFMNKSKEESAIMTRLSSMKDSSSIVVLNYIKDVFSGKESFRN